MARYRFALVACARWENDSIVEWLEYHKSIGFDHVYLYSNDDDPMTLLQTVTSYVLGDDPYVTYRHFPPSEYQVPIYFNFLEHFKHETEWYAFLDIDEFFVFRNCDDVRTFMTDRADGVDCLYFNWVCFGNDGKPTRDASPTLTTYRRRARMPDVHTKILCRSAKIDPVAVRRQLAVDHVPFWHFLDTYGLPDLRCRDVLGRSMDGYSADFPTTAAPFVAEPDVARDILGCAYIAHYQFKSEADFMRRWRRGGSAFSEHWRQVYETGAHRAILALRNEVQDDYLADYWRRHTGTVAAVDQPIDKTHGQAMGPIGICGVFKDEGPFLLEWIAYHLGIGFDHIVLFDNGSDDGGAEIVRNSVFDRYVTIIDWPQRRGQMTAFKFFCVTFSKFFEWVAFIDIDEFIHPLDHDSVKDLLPRYDGASGVLIQWLTFASSGHNARPPGLIIENFSARLPEDHGRCKWVKSLLWTKDILDVGDGPHVFKVSGKLLNTRGEIVPPHAGIHPCHDNLVINHYFTRSKQDWDFKTQRGPGFGGDYRSSQFEEHDRAATERDDRIKRFAPKVRQILAAGPPRRSLGARPLAECSTAPSGPTSTTQFPDKAPMAPCSRTVDPKSRAGAPNALDEAMALLNEIRGSSPPAAAVTRPLPGPVMIGPDRPD